MRMIGWALVLVVVLVVAYWLIPWAILQMNRLRDPRKDNRE
jgi:hypothetical protein